MKRDALQLVRGIYRANKSVHKKEHLETFLYSSWNRDYLSGGVAKFVRVAADGVTGWHGRWHLGR